MTKKQIKTMALKIAECEKILNNAYSTEEEKRKAKETIQWAGTVVKSMEDFIAIDALVVKMLEK